MTLLNFRRLECRGRPAHSSVALALGQLGSQKLSSLNNQTFGGNYAQTVSDLGNSISSVNDNLNNSQAVAQMLSNDRTSASGVSFGRRDD